MSSEELLKQYSELLTQRVSELLTSRLERLFPPSRESHNIRDEFAIIFTAAKGRKWLWVSVFDVALLLMEKDYTAAEMAERLHYKLMTIYRALHKLEKQGFCVNREGLWMINEATCPILYWHIHDSQIVVLC
ncbi:MAG: hypothetical protein M1503_02475 [Thaumarchaeota archaeon]|nr:hypothetical protein [Nitrososphaerota archaeon]MCL5317116.1 hypothetical protein [Nitrososphaerota archaeon]